MGRAVWGGQVGEEVDEAATEVEVKRKMKLQVESSSGGHAGLAFNALVCVCVWLCKKKYDTHKLKLAANARWQRRMRIVLYLLGGSIKPLKRRRHKTPQAGVITL